MVVIPALNVFVPTGLRPVDGELPVVAPDIVQVRPVIVAQVAEAAGAATLILAVQLFPVVPDVMLAGQVIVGGTVSINVIC